MSNGVFMVLVRCIDLGCKLAAVDDAALLLELVAQSPDLAEHCGACVAFIA